jgi:hypothetical protein
MRAILMCYKQGSELADKVVVWFNYEDAAVVIVSCSFEKLVAEAGDS